MLVKSPVSSLRKPAATSLDSGSPPPPSIMENRATFQSSGMRRPSSSRHSESPERGLSGCLTCRARRMRCDGHHPTCRSCIQGDFDCLWPDVGPSRRELPSPKAARRGDRSRLACLPCRSRKTRCAGPPDGDTTRPCSRCDRLAIDCSWAKRKRPNQQRDESVEDLDDRRTSRTESPVVGDRDSRAQSPVVPAIRTSRLSALELLMANRSDLNNIIGLYFRTVHYFGFFSYVHEPSFFRLLNAGRAPQSLTAMMVVCTMHFACENTHANMERTMSIYEDNIRQLLDSAYSGFGVIELMALMLARLYEPCRGRFKSSWMMWGTAVRMMQYLSLHTFDETYPDAPSLRLNPLLKREALRRVAWSVFFQDTMYDNGHHGGHLVHESAFHIQLPCDEATFMRGTNVTTAPLFPKATDQSPWGSTISATPEGLGHIGLSAHLLRAAAMRRRVLHYRSLIRYSPDSPRKMLDDLSVFEKELKQVINDFPPELSYTEDNLFVHSQARTAFVFLHLIRHNCFLMLGQTRLNICAKDDSLVMEAVQFAKDRLRHALPVSKIFADVLRHDITCDPSFSAHAYTSLENILFDPLKIASMDPSTDPRDPRYVEALKVLLDLIRKECKINAKTRLLRIEACRRLIRCGFEELVTQADKEACRNDLIRSKDDAEYDFRIFGVHQVEIRRQRKAQSGKPPTADAWLHTGGVPPSNVPSRLTSPEPPGMDAGADIKNTESEGVGSVDTYKAPNIPFLDDIQTHLTGVDMPLVAPQNGIGRDETGGGSSSFWPPLLDVDQRRWMNLDYGFDFEDNGFTQEDTLVQQIDPTAFDDFSRFLQQSGETEGQDTELFPW